jgi:hypothetical protein
MQLQAADCAGLDEASGLSNRLRPSIRVEAGEGDGDVGILGGELCDDVVESRGTPLSVSSTVNTTQAMLRER